MFETCGSNHPSVTSLPHAIIASERLSTASVWNSLTINSFNYFDPPKFWQKNYSNHSVELGSWGLVFESSKMN